MLTTGSPYHHLGDDFSTVGCQSSLDKVANPSSHVTTEFTAWCPYRIWLRNPSKALPIWAPASNLLGLASRIANHVDTRGTVVDGDSALFRTGEAFDMKPSMRTKIGSMFVVAMFLTTAWVGCIPAFDMDLSFSFSSDAEATTYSVTYHVGDTSIDSNVDSDYTVKSLEDLEYEGAGAIDGWSTTDGGSTTYIVHQEITISTDLDLYPVWQNGDVIYLWPAEEQTYTQDRGTAEYLEILGNDADVLEGKFLPKTGYKFFCWCDSEDGYGVTYQPGDRYDAVKEDLTLYPMFVLEADADSYCGPKLKFAVSTDNVLTISGEGPMSEYDEGEFPWKDKVGTIVGVKLPYGIKTISSYAFEGISSSNFTEIFIPDGVESIGDGVFKGCTNLATIKVGANNSHYMAEDGVLYLKDTIDSGSVGKHTLICYPPANRGLLDIDVFIVPYYVESISDYAFYGNTHLEQIIITEKVQSIGKRAFYGCITLKSVSAPNGLTSIGESAFQNCTGLRVVQIGTGLTTLGANAFKNCTSLFAVVMDFNRVSNLDVGGAFVDSSGTAIGFYDFYPGFRDSAGAHTGLGYYNSAGVLLGYYDSEGAFTGETEPTARTISAMQTGHIYLTTIIKQDTKKVYEEPKWNGHYDYNGNKGGFLAIEASDRSVRILAGIPQADDQIIDDNGHSGEKDGLLVIQGGAVKLPRYVVQTNAKTVYIPESAERVYNGDATHTDRGQLENRGLCVVYYITSNFKPNGSVTGGTWKLEKIVVSEDNADLKTIDGDLYQKDDQGDFTILNKQILSGKNVSIISERAQTGSSGVSITGGSKKVPNAIIFESDELDWVYDHITGSTTNAEKVPKGAGDYYYSTYVDSLILDSYKSIKGSSSNSFRYHLKTLIINDLDQVDNFRAMKHYGVSALKIYSGITGEFVSPYKEEPVKEGSSDIWQYYHPGIYVTDPSYVFSQILDENGNPTGLWWNSVPASKSQALNNNPLDTDKVITITGTGAMPDYDESFIPPWYDLDVFVVNINDGITNIGSNAFKDQTHMVSVNLPSTITKIGSAAFQNTALSQVFIPYSVTEIGDDSFIDCSQLTRFSVSTIAEWTKDGSTVYGNQVYSSYNGILMSKDQTKVICCPAGLTGSIELPESATTIGSYAFHKGAISSVTMSWTGGGITTVGIHAFESSDIESVSLDKVTSIGQYSFADCTSLASMTTGNVLSTIPSHAFEGCEMLYEIAFGRSVVFENYSMPYKMKYDPAMGDIEGKTVDEQGYLYDDIGYYSIYTKDGDSSERVKVRSHNIPLTNEYMYMAIPITTTNKCGDSLYWTFLDTRGRLLITGSGDMYDTYSADNKPGWYSVRASISTLSMPSAMTSIGQYSFKDLTGLKTVNMPSRLSSIGDYAFYGSGLDAVTIPAGITIGVHSFEGTHIETLNLRIASIPESAFADILELRSVSFSNAVTTIGVNAFAGCSALETVIFATACTVQTSSFPTVENGWFLKGEGDALKTIPSPIGACYYTLTSIPTAETNCGTKTAGVFGDNLKYKLVNGIVIITGSGAMGDLSSGGSELWQGSQYTDVIFPTGITYIGSYAFEAGEHKSIGTLDLSSQTSLSIGQGAFSGINITELMLGSNVAIGTKAFKNCSSMMRITTGPGMTLGNSAFEGCTGLSTLSISGLISAGDDVFKGCTGLTSVEVSGASSSSTQVGDSMFEDCTSMVSAKMSALNHLGEYAFKGCTSIMVAELDNIPSTGSSLFQGCTGLTTLKISHMTASSTSMAGIVGPITLTINGTSIGQGAFEDHSTIVELRTATKIANDASTSTIAADAFKGCTSLTTVSLTDTVSIGANAFEGCSSLSQFTATGTLTTIAQDAFKGLSGYTANGSVMRNTGYTPGINFSVVNNAITSHVAPMVELATDLEYSQSVSGSKTIHLDLSGHKLTVPTTGLTVAHRTILYTEDSSPLDTGRFATSSDTVGVPYYDWIHIDTPDRAKYMIGSNTYWRALHNGELLLSHDSFDFDGSKAFVKWNNGSTGTMCDQCLLNLQDEGEYYTQIGNASFGTADGFIVKAVTSDVSYRSTYEA